MTAMGLSDLEAARRLARDGPNALPDPETRPAARIALQALREPMILLLLAAGGVYLALGDGRDALLLSASIVLVVALTVFQEYRAERALQALREQGSPLASVLRDGTPKVIASRDVVVGDIMLVVAGDRLAADARVVEATELAVDESLLTGESLPVRKQVSADADTGALRAGTLVVEGSGTAEVVATGANTGYGRIGIALRNVRAPPTPLQRQMRGLVRMFAWLSLASCAVVVLAMHARGNGMLDSLLAGITLAIATIPEEFPVVVTVYLALGAWRLSRRAVLVRRPAAIEALGSVTVLCSDKTGTLTENRMRIAEVSDDRPDGADDLVEVGALAVPRHPVDPMDIALRDATPGARERWEPLREYPFSAARRRVGMAWRTPDGDIRVAVKGAPEAVAAACGLSDARRSEIDARVARMAAQGLRVLGVADASVGAVPEQPEDPGLRWCGLIAFADPLREGVPDAVAQARAAGVRVLMLTGDHAQTARSIARQAGLARTERVALGDVFADDDGTQGVRALAGTDVFARVRPEHKLRLVEVLQRQGEVVAMTGDGVNDAPALAAAHVGVAMGKRGTDVAREAASIVLMDDDFATIVHAITEGRRIYDNMRRAVRYILAVHVPITCLALLPALLGIPPVLAPIHVVFLQLIIDPTCSIVFESEPADRDIMRRPPRPTTQRLVPLPALVATLLQGAAMFLPVLAIDVVARRWGWPPAQVAALDFTALVAGNLALLALYRPGASLLGAISHRNRAVAVIAFATLSLLVLVTQVAPAAAWLGFVPPPLAGWCVALLAPFALAAVLKRWHLRA